MAGDGDVKALRQLVVREGAEVLLKQEEMMSGGRSPFYCAARDGRLAVLELIWGESSVGPQLALMVNDGGWTPLLAAAYNGHLHVVTWLLADEQRCPPAMVRAVTNDRSSHPQSTALHWAAYHGHEAVVRLLATRYPDLIPMVNKDGKTAAQLAREENRQQVIELFGSLAAQPPPPPPLYQPPPSLLLPPPAVLPHQPLHAVDPTVARQLAEKDALIAQLLRELAALQLERDQQLREWDQRRLDHEDIVAQLQQTNMELQRSNTQLQLINSEWQRAFTQEQAEKDDLIAQLNGRGDHGLNIQQQRQDMLFAQVDRSVQRFEWSEIVLSTNSFSDRLKVGEGGQGSVYITYLREIDVAIKVLDPDTPWATESFESEIATLGRLCHRRLVPLVGYSVGRANECCLVYKALQVANLRDLLLLRTDRPPLTVVQRVLIGIGIAEAVAFLHQNNVVHRDIKPSNVLLDHRCEPFLGDFGIARSIARDQTTSAAGSLDYMDPFALRARRPDPQHDVYSLGMVLVQLVTGKSVDVVHELSATWEESPESVRPMDHVDTEGDLEWLPRIANPIFELGMRCMSVRRHMHRPTAKEVLERMQALRPVCGRVLLGSID